MLDSKLDIKRLGGLEDIWFRVDNRDQNDTLKAP